VQVKLSCSLSLGQPLLGLARYVNLLRKLLAPFGTRPFSRSARLSPSILITKVLRAATPFRGAAMELIKKLQNNELQTFATTVANCLNPSSPTHLKFDLEQDMFLDWYYQEIVMPLKEDYAIFLR
jgi:hypothetical protein